MKAPRTYTYIQKTVQFKSKIQHTENEFRLPPRNRWDLRSPGILRRVLWQFLSDVSELPTWFLDQSHRLARNVGKELSLYAGVISQKNADLTPKFDRPQYDRNAVHVIGQQYPSATCDSPCFHPRRKNSVRIWKMLVHFFIYFLKSRNSEIAQLEPA